MILFLDTGVLGAIVNPRPRSDEVKQIKLWTRRMLQGDHILVVPALCDYELRRELILQRLTDSLLALDLFNVAAPGRYLPLADTALKIAADCWAQARQGGMTTADPKELNGDMVLAGQVLDQGLAPADYIVATTNVGHLGLFLNVAHWSAITE